LRDHPQIALLADAAKEYSHVYYINNGGKDDPLDGDVSIENIVIEHIDNIMNIIKPVNIKIKSALYDDDEEFYSNRYYFEYLIKDALLKLIQILIDIQYQHQNDHIGIEQCITTVINYDEMLFNRTFHLVSHYKCNLLFGIISVITEVIPYNDLSTLAEIIKQQGLVRTKAKFIDNEQTHHMCSKLLKESHRESSK
jgi:hypothetical protein